MPSTSHNDPQQRSKQQQLCQVAGETRHDVWRQSDGPLAVPALQHKRQVWREECAIQG